MSNFFFKKQYFQRNHFYLKYKVGIKALFELWTVLLKIILKNIYFFNCVFNQFDKTLRKTLLY